MGNPIVDIDWREIRSPRKFEHLVKDYLKELGTDKSLDIVDIKTEPAGHGPDGGTDILLRLRVHDGVDDFERLWVVQCKYYKRTVRLSDLHSVNIPSLLHSKGAHGYLLVMKEDISAALVQHFKDLSANCHFNRSYLWWDGNEFKRRLRDKEQLYPHYFPKLNVLVENRKKSARNRSKP